MTTQTEKNDKGKVYLRRSVSLTSEFVPTEEFSKKNITPY